MTRERMPDRRNVWRQKVRVLDENTGENQFYVEFGEYRDGRLGEVFLTAKKCGTFVRGVMDTLARSVSLSLQHGVSAAEIAEQMRGQTYPPFGCVDAPGSTVGYCTSIADYLAREIEACYDADGKRKPDTAVASPEPDVVTLREIPEDDRTDEFDWMSLNLQRVADDSGETWLMLDGFAGDNGQGKVSQMRSLHGVPKSGATPDELSQAVREFNPA